MYLHSTSVRSSTDILRSSQWKNPFIGTSGGWHLYHYSFKSQYTTRSSTGLAKPAPPQLIDEVGVASNIAVHQPNNRKRRIFPKVDHSKDIVINDLRATLEAHRATNRASVIRKVGTEDPFTGSRFKRLSSLSPVEEPSDQSLPDNSDAVSPQESHEHVASIKPDHVVWQREQAPQAAGRGRVNVAVQDYEGKAPAPGHYWEIRHSYTKRRGFYSGGRQRPWLSHLENYAGDGLQRLQDEIGAFESYMNLTTAETLAVQELLEDIRHISFDTLPSNPIYVHGSRSTGLAGPLSDIDFSLSLPEFEKDPLARGPSATRPEAVRAGMRMLVALRGALEQHQHFRAIEIIGARLPLLSAVDRRTGLKFQIQALAPTLPAKEYTLYYLTEFPTLRPLFILLRSALQMRGLTRTITGGMGSYSLLMMIVTALKHSMGIFPRRDLSSQLLHVLNFYASADLYKNGYSVDPPRTFPKVGKSLSAEEKEARAHDPYLSGIDVLPKLSRKQPWLLCLQDPANPVNDLGSKAHQIKHIQAFFKEAGHRIRMRMREWENLDIRERKGWGKAVLDSLVQANYDTFEAGRRRLVKKVPPKEATH